MSNTNELDPYKDKYCVYQLIKSGDRRDASHYETIIDFSDDYTLRDCIGELFKTRTNMVDSPLNKGREWRAYTVNNSMEFETGEYESRTLCFPMSMSDRNIERITKLLNNQ